MVLQVCDGNNLVIANTFIVKGRQKSIELLARLAHCSLFTCVHSAYSYTVSNSNRITKVP